MRQMGAAAAQQHMDAAAAWYYHHNQSRVAASALNAAAFNRTQAGVDPVWGTQLAAMHARNPVAGAHRSRPKQSAMCWRASCLPRGAMYVQWAVGG